MCPGAHLVTSFLCSSTRDHLRVPWDGVAFTGGQRKAPAFPGHGWANPALLLSYQKYEIKQSVEKVAALLRVPHRPPARQAAPLSQRAQHASFIKSLKQKQEKENKG